MSLARRREIANKYARSDRGKYMERRRRHAKAQHGKREIRWCKKCQVDKEFYVNKGNSAYCRDCVLEAAAKRWRDVGSTPAVKTYKRKYRLKRIFNITVEQYDQMLANQGGVCAICGQIPTGVRKRFAVDHDHRCCSGQTSCGECIRGLLCHLCNHAIARLDAIPEWEVKARGYLNGE